VFAGVTTAPCVTVFVTFAIAPVPEIVPLFDIEPKTHIVPSTTNCLPEGTVTVVPLGIVISVAEETMTFLYWALESADVKSLSVVTEVTISAVRNTALMVVFAVQLAV